VIDAKTDLDEQDDLTLVYMFGYKNGKDSLKDEIERLLLIEQGAAEPCDTCGWRMKFPNAECRNCENVKLRDEIERLRAALRQLAEIDKIENGFIRIKEVIHYTRFMARAALGETIDDAAT
jgi:hypothetical protein